MPRQISLDTIRDAPRHIYTVARRTPLVRLDATAAPSAGATEIHLKLETLQPIGSFKIRGASNAVRQLTQAERSRGVWTVSAGNAAQGVALAARALKPDTKIFAAEPETAAPLACSLAAGTARTFDGWRASFVDGCGGKSVTPTMWPLLRDLVDGAIVVSLEEVKRAMRLIASRAHVITEGAGACAVAAALSGRAGGGRIAAVVSGGNIDLPTFARLVTEA